MAELFQDLRYGLRTLVKSPGLTAVAVITLALGVGVNTAVFSVVNSMLLRPLPVQDPDRLVVPGQQLRDSTFFASFSYPDFVDYRNQTSAFLELSAYQLTLVGLSANGKAERAAVTYVAGNYFTLLGVKPALGRLIVPAEGQSPGADPILVLGYSYWKRRFNGDPDIIGKSVLVNGHPVTIVGVASRGFHGAYSLVESDGYLPLSVAVVQKNLPHLWTARGDRALSVLGRLKHGISILQGEASLNVVAGRLAREYPDTNSGIVIRLFSERLARPEPEPNNSLPMISTLFLALASLVLAVACINVANILLVRGSVRHQEMAIRAAVGASRGRLICELLTESVLLSLMGGVAGIIIGRLSSGLLASLRLHIDIPIRLDFSFDWRVFAYGFAIALLTGILAGVIPALRASRADLLIVLHEGGRALSPGRGRQRFRNALIVLQVAGSLVLLIVGGLFVRSLEKARQMYLGFDPHHVLNMSMDVREGGYDEARGKEFYRELETRIRALPGVRSVSQAFSVPFGYYRQKGKVYVEGAVLPPGEQPPELFYNVVSPDYFETLLIPIVRDQVFTEADNETAPRVAIVNETMSKRFWPNEDPVGKRFRLDSASGPFIRVVGVAKDGKYIGPTETVQSYFFVPLDQHYMPVRTLQVRSAVPPETLMGEVQQQVRTLDPNLPIFDVQTMDRALEGVNGFFLFQIGAGLATVLGGLGLVLSVVGIYGVISYATAQRAHEMGIRVALGAQPRDIVNIILKQGVRLLGLGVLVGLLATLLITSVMSTLLVGVTGTDPLTFALVVLLIMTVGLAACYIPARRAMHVNPVFLLRSQ